MQYSERTAILGQRKLQLSLSSGLP